MRKYYLKHTESTTSAGSSQFEIYNPLFVNTDKVSSLQIGKNLGGVNNMTGEFYFAEQVGNQESGAGNGSEIHMNYYRNRNLFYCYKSGMFSGCRGN